MACRGSGVQIPLAPLLEDINDPERQARKILDQLLKKKLLIDSKQVRNKKNTFHLIAFNCHI